MPTKAKTVKSEDRRKARADLEKLFEGLCHRFKDPAEYLSKDLIEIIQEINTKILPNANFERNWGDHFNMVDAIIKANNEETILFKAKVKRLGNLGVLLITEPTIEAETDLEAHCASPYHPFAILLAANIKHQFRDLSVTIKPTIWKGRISETEIIMQ